MEETNNDIAGSIFFLLLFLLSIGGLLLLMVQAFATDNTGAGILALIFFAMTVAGLIFAIITQKYKLLDFASFGEASSSFLAGFIMWMVIGGSSAKSVLSISSNSLFSSIASELPLFVEFIMEAIVIPFSEETFWIIGIPAIILTIMEISSKKYPIFKSAWLQLTTVILIGGISFAGFHVQKYILPFLISAFIFRTVMYVFILGDKFYDWFKWGAVAIAFSYGAHVGNNWGNWGFMNGIGLLNQNLFPIGILVYIFFLALIWGSIDQIGTWVMKNEK